MITHPVLSRLAMTGIRLGLDRVREFLTVLGEPHLKYGVVHVGGTNGKGSTVAMVARSLQAAGYRVGANHSPHTSEVNERIVIDGAPIDDAFLSACIGEVERARDAWALTAGIDGEPLTLTSHELALLVVFVRRAGRVLSREQLLTLTHAHGDEVFERAIDVQVSRLRQKLGDDARRPRWIKTVRGDTTVVVDENRPVPL